MTYTPEKRREYYLKNREKEILLAADWQKSNKEKKSAYKKKSRLLSRYGITVEQYNEMFEKQTGCCALCRKHQSEMPRALAVDHCHQTGRVRGLLCTSCNTGLGKLGDTITALERAIQYLKGDTNGCLD